MSVAFRRESDDEHKEPEFELPIPVGPNLVTARGLEQLAERLAAIDAEVSAQTDPEALKKLRREQRYWQTQHATAQLAPPPEPDEVGIGSRVTIRQDGRTRSFTIVGHDEADPTASLIVFTAPLARAVMGAMAGERVDFAGKSEAVEIIAID